MSLNGTGPFRTAITADSQPLRSDTWIPLLSLQAIDAALIACKNSISLDRVFLVRSLNWSGKTTALFSLQDLICVSIAVKVCKIPLTPILRKTLL